VACPIYTLWGDAIAKREGICRWVKGKGKKKKIAGMQDFGNLANEMTPT